MANSNDRTAKTFDQIETERQAEFKRKNWSATPDGLSDGRPYPHILPDIIPFEEVFYPPIRSAVLAYLGDEIAVHSQVKNLKSSQVACFNILFPLSLDLNLAARVLKPVLPGVREVQAIDFEYTGPDGATEWLGEPVQGKRGQNRTSIDAAIEWTDGIVERLSLVEFKYTEQSFGQCGAFRSSGNSDKDACTEENLTLDQRASRCYLTREPHQRTYWDHLKDAGIDTNLLSRVKGCPFRGPFYQLLRQFLLAAYIRQTSKREVDIVCLGFANNTSLTSAPKYLKGLGGNVIDTWNTLLIGVPKLRYVHVEEVVNLLSLEDPNNVGSWLAYLEERYGLKGNPTPGNVCSQDQQPTELEQALAELERGFMSLPEYRDSVQAGLLVKKGLWEDDCKFQERYPDHPLAMDNRFARIKAADQIRDLARRQCRPFSQAVLDRLHKLLFDCCAPVRMSIAEALFCAGNQSSAPFLQSLTVIDDESAMVRRYAGIAFERCKVRGCTDVPQAGRRIFVVLQNIELVGTLLDVARDAGAHVFFGEPDSPDIIAVPSDIRVVDRNLLGEEAWNAYCSYLDEVNDDAAYPILDETGEVLIREPLREDVPIIIVDSELPQSINKFTKPNKPEGCVHYISPWLPDLVVEKVREVLTSQDGQDVE